MTFETPAIPISPHAAAEPLVRVACRPAQPGADGHDVRFAWPADALPLLEREFAALGVDLHLEVRGRMEPPGAAPEPSASSIVYADPRWVAYAEAYAVSTGATPLRLQDGPLRCAADGDPSVLVADLLATPLAVLDRAGCLPWTPQYAGTSIIHVDDGTVGLRHLLKNLLACLGLFPYHAGKLVLASQFSRARVLQSAGETYLFGPVPPATLRMELSRGHRHLLMSAHSNAFHGLMGGVLLCSNCASDGGMLPPSAPAAGDRVLSCFSGGACLRGDDAQRIPVSEVRANHVFWVGCDLVVYGDNLYRSPRALPLVLLGGRDVVSLVAPLRKEHGGFGDLLNACFLLDDEHTLGAFRDAANRYGERARGIPRTHLLLGDPRVAVGGGDPGHRAPVLYVRAEALRAGIPVRSARQRLVLDALPLLTGATTLRTRCEPADAAVLGCILPRADGGAEATLLAFDSGGRPPATLSLRVDPTADRDAQLRRWLRRAGFWRLLLLVMRERLSAAGTHAPLLAECTSSLMGIAELEHMIQRTLASALQVHEGEVEGRSGVEGWMTVLQRLVATLQPRLLALVTAFAGLVEPRLHFLWMPAAVAAGPPRSVDTRCGCGLRCERQIHRLPGTGIRRALYTCIRCGYVLERDVGEPPLRFAVDDPSRVRAGRVTGILHGIGALDAPYALGASLRPEGRADPRLVRVDAGEGQAPGSDLPVVFQMQAVRPPSVQPVHLYVVQDLSLRMCITWVQTTGPEPSSGAGPHG